MNTTITNEEKKAAALWAFMFFIPVFMKTRTEFVTFYMKQNFWLFILHIVSQVLLSIFVKIVFYFSWTINDIANTSWQASTKFIVYLNYFTIAFSLVWVWLLILSIFLIVKAYKWERYEVPYLFKYTNLLISKMSFLEKIFSTK